MELSRVIVSPSIPFTEDILLKPLSCLAAPCFCRHFVACTTHRATAAGNSFPPRVLECFVSPGGVSSLSLFFSTRACILNAPLPFYPQGCRRWLASSRSITHVGPTMPRPPPVERHMRWRRGSAHTRCVHSHSCLGHRLTCLSQSVAVTSPMKQAPVNKGVCVVQGLPHLGGE